MVDITVRADTWKWWKSDGILAHFFNLRNAGLRTVRVVVVGDGWVGGGCSFVRSSLLRHLKTFPLKRDELVVVMIKDISLAFIWGSKLPCKKPHMMNSIACRAQV